MEAMRDVLRGSLARSLETLGDPDRLAAAWTVACGRAMAGHVTVVEYDAGVVRVEVTDAVWLKQMMALRGVLEREVGRISGLKVVGIEFAMKKPVMSARQLGVAPARRRRQERLA